MKLDRPCAIGKDPTNDCAVALGWTPEGGEEEWPLTKQRMVEVERNNASWSFWNAVRRAVSDRHQWKNGDLGSYGS